MDKSPPDSYQHQIPFMKAFPFQFLLLSLLPNKKIPKEVY